MAHWLTQHIPGGFPIENAPIGVRDSLGPVYWRRVAVARQVKLDGHDIAEGMGPDSAEVKLQAESVARYLAG